MLLVTVYDGIILNWTQEHRCSVLEETLKNISLSAIFREAGSFYSTLSDFFPVSGVLFHWVIFINKAILIIRLVKIHKCKYKRRLVDLFLTPNTSRPKVQGH